jgi:hypothetical protein
VTPNVELGSGWGGGGLVTDSLEKVRGGGGSGEAGRQGGDGVASAVGGARGVVLDRRQWRRLGCGWGRRGGVG